MLTSRCVYKTSTSQKKPRNAPESDTDFSHKKAQKMCLFVSASFVLFCGPVTRDLSGPYQPSIVLIAVTARFSYAAMVAMFFFSTSVSDASVKFGSALYQSKLEKYFCSHGSRS